MQQATNMTGEGEEYVGQLARVWDEKSGQLVAYQLARWMLTEGQVRQASGLNISRCDTEQWLAPIKPHLQHLAAASSAGTSLEANLKHHHHRHRQRLRLYGAQDRALKQFLKKLEEEMTEASMERRKHAKQLMVFFGAAGFGTQGGWGADAVLRACCKVVCRPRGTERVVLVDEHRTSRAPCSSQEATRPAASEPGPSTPPPAKHSRRTKAEQAAEPTQPTKGKGKAKGRAAKPNPGPGSLAQWAAMPRSIGPAISYRTQGAPALPSSIPQTALTYTIEGHSQSLPDSPALMATGSEAQTPHIAMPAHSSATACPTIVCHGLAVASTAWQLSVLPSEVCLAATV
ncbi:hypothetical protein QJQ45_008806 [Haematococcus lacustris]|nr:hypothetical protein QJQ45_008806 [Haematococcus lacustris]